MTRKPGDLCKTLYALIPSVGRFGGDRKQTIFSELGSRLCCQGVFILS